MKKKMTDEELKNELLRLHAGCMTYYEMFEPEKHKRYSLEVTETDVEEDEVGYSSLLNLDTSGLNLWIKEVGLPYLCSQGLI
jgi:hypothetical protein